MNDPIFDEFTAILTNAQLAKALEYIAPRLDSELARAIMQQAAKRLRGEPEPHFGTSPPPDLPPLKAYAEAPDADSTPLGLIVDQIARGATEKMRC